MEVIQSFYCDHRLLAAGMLWLNGYDFKESAERIEGGGIKGGSGGFFGKPALLVRPAPKPCLGAFAFRAEYPGVETFVSERNSPVFNVDVPPAFPYN